MRRRSFLQSLLAGGGLLTWSSLPGCVRGDGTKAGARAAISTDERGPIFDVHLHAYPGNDPLDASLANPVTGKAAAFKNGAEHRRACLAEMERLGVVRGVVSGGDGDRIGAALEWQQAAPDRIFAAAGIRGSQDTPLPELATLRAAFAGHQLHVLGEVTAQYAGLTLSDPQYDPYLALAAEFDVPVAVHTGMGPPGISYDPCCHGFRAALGNPSQLEECLNRHPKLRLNVMHGGWPYLQDTIALLFTYPQVHTDLGAIDWALPRAEFHAYLEALVRAGLGKRILFGTDQMFWPEAIGMAVDAVDAATFLTREQKRDIFYGNAARFFRI